LGTSKLELIWTSEAEQDVLGIGEYCEEKFGLAVAHRVLSEYETIAETLCGQPSIGRVVKATEHEGMIVRHHPHKWSQIYYCFSATQLIILRVFYTRIHPGKTRP
jgi:plasmid stabilization system protein ParE